MTSNATPPKRPWTAGRILYNVLALVGGLALIWLSSSSRRFRGTHMDNVQEDSAEMTLYAIVGGIIVVVVIIGGLVFLGNQRHAAESTRIVATSTASQREVLVTEMKKHLETWQADHSQGVHRVTRDQLALDPDIQLVEIDYGYCDAANFYAYAITKMQGTLSTGAYGDMISFTTTHAKCAPENWLTYPVTDLGSGWAAGAFGVIIPTRMPNAQ